MRVLGIRQRVLYGVRLSRPVSSHIVCTTGTHTHRALKSVFVFSATVYFYNRSPYKRKAGEPHAPRQVKRRFLKRHLIFFRCYSNTNISIYFNSFQFTTSSSSILSLSVYAAFLIHPHSGQTTPYSGLLISVALHFRHTLRNFARLRSLLLNTLSFYHHNRRSRCPCRLVHSLLRTKRTLSCVCTASRACNPCTAQPRQHRLTASAPKCHTVP